METEGVHSPQWPIQLDNLGRWVVITCDDMWPVSRIPRDQPPEETQHTGRDQPQVSPETMFWEFETLPRPYSAVMFHNPHWLTLLRGERVANIWQHAMSI